jgi:hypothetical protein
MIALTLQNFILQMAYTLLITRYIHIAGTTRGLKGWALVPRLVNDDDVDGRYG